MATTVLGNVLEFFGRIGVFDVVLPFIITFTLVYAVLDRTRILGHETIGKETHPKRNLNAMAAFAIGFLVIASSRLVEAVSSISGNVVLLLLLGIFFLMLIGSFYSEGKIGKEGLQDGWMKNTFLVIMFVGMLVIFLNAIKNAAGQTWLDYTFDYLYANWSSNVVASLILIILVILFIGYLTRGPKEEKPKEKKD